MARARRRRACFVPTRLRLLRRRHIVVDGDDRQSGDGRQKSVPSSPTPVAAAAAAAAAADVSSASNCQSHPCRTGRQIRPCAVERRYAALRRREEPPAPTGAAYPTAPPCHRSHDCAACPPSRNTQGNSGGPRLPSPPPGPPPAESTRRCGSRAGGRPPSASRPARVRSRGRTDPVPPRVLPPPHQGATTFCRSPTRHPTCRCSCRGVVGVDCRRGRGRRITALFGQGNISGNYLP